MCILENCLGRPKIEVVVITCKLVEVRTCVSFVCFLWSLVWEFCWISFSLKSHSYYYNNFFCENCSLRKVSDWAVLRSKINRCIFSCAILEPEDIYLVLPWNQVQRFNRFFHLSCLFIFFLHWCIYCVCILSIYTCVWGARICFWCLLLYLCMMWVLLAS